MVAGVGADEACVPACSAVGVDGTFVFAFAFAFDCRLPDCFAVNGPSVVARPFGDLGV